MSKFKPGDMIRSLVFPKVNTAIVQNPVNQEAYYLFFKDGSKGNHDTKWIDRNYELAEAAPVVGRKDDSGKPKLSMLFTKGLLPAVTVLVRVLEHGAIKYPEVDNWTSVQNGSERYRNAAIRHIAARTSGEILDPDSKQPHMGHAACSVLFSLAFDLVGSK